MGRCQPWVKSVGTSFSTPAPTTSKVLGPDTCVQCVIFGTRRHALMFKGQELVGLFNGNGGFPVGPFENKNTRSTLNKNTPTKLVRRETLAEKGSAFSPGSRTWLTMSRKHPLMSVCSCHMPKCEVGLRTQTKRCILKLHIEMS